METLPIYRLVSLREIHLYYFISVVDAGRA